MTPIADMVEKLLLAGVAAELVVLAVRTAEAALRGCQQKSKTVGKRPPAESVRKPSRLDVGWKPNEADREYAANLGLISTAIDRQAESFRDYWVSCANKSAVKLDWSCAWRNWCRRLVEDKPQLAATKQRTYQEAVAAATPEVRERVERFQRKLNGTRSLFDAVGAVLPPVTAAVRAGPSAA